MFNIFSHEKSKKYNIKRSKQSKLLVTIRKVKDTVVG